MWFNGAYMSDKFNTKQEEGGVIAPLKGKKTCEAEDVSWGVICSDMDPSWPSPLSSGAATEKGHRVLQDIPAWDFCNIRVNFKCTVWLYYFAVMSVRTPATLMRSCRMESSAKFRHSCYYLPETFIRLLYHEIFHLDPLSHCTVGLQASAQCGEVISDDILGKILKLAVFQGHCHRGLWHCLSVNDSTPVLYWFHMMCIQ